ncbi:hypothetical protein [Haloferula sp. BvORR071]|uniref:hypothetical protein n=1 Tax=Haloferula sp. BvORR071 TaxID=1396141 RepID=UPI00055655A3|nr:hypothetical protein [Haloferula sp. BvORR071]
MPLHRSLLFWFGFLVLGFQVWVWQDSRTTYSFYRWYAGSHHSMGLISSQRSEIVLSRWRVDPDERPGVDFRQVEPGLPGGFDRNFTGGLMDTGPWFPQPGFEHRSEDYQMVVGGSVGRIEADLEWWRVAHWLVVLCYLPLWLGLAMWRARRIAKARRAILGKPGAFYVRVVAR